MNWWMGHQIIACVNSLAPVPVMKIMKGKFVRRVQYGKSKQRNAMQSAELALTKKKLPRYWCSNAQQGGSLDKPGSGSNRCRTLGLCGVAYGRLFN